MTDDRITILLARRLAGELTPEEAEELRLALEQDPMLLALSSAIDGVTDAPSAGTTEKEERQMLERGLRQWKQRATGLQNFSSDAEEGDEQVSGSEEGNTIALPQASPSRRIRLVRWSAVAAVILGIAGVYQYASRSPKPQAPVILREVAAKYGTRSQLDLPDGSRLWLNAGSKVSFAEGFATGKRELTLSGEGYFDVKHDPSKPFIIHTGSVDVKVLGTTLNVRAYPLDGFTETTLIQGKAELDLPWKSTGPIQLRPGEKVTMSNAEAGVSVYGLPIAASAAKMEEGRTIPPNFQRHAVTVDPTYKTIIETSWVEDKLVFRKEPFREVAAKLERWYNIRFHFANNKYLDEELTGYFKDQPIKNVMDGLQISLGFHYEIAGDSILIR